MVRLVSTLACVALLDQADAAGDIGRIGKRSDGFLVDEAGRVRIFRGFNDIQKAKGHGPFDGTNYVPVYLERESNIEMLEAMGFNGFRIPMMWAAVQPTSDLVPDESYLARMMNVTQSLERHHMYGLLDMHKDVVGMPANVSEYDGYPRWLVDRTVPKHPHPWPFTQEQLDEKGWGFGYFTEQDAQVLQETYDNTHGGMDAMEEFWRTVANYYKDQLNVLGYELINEPWAGNEFANPLYMLPGYAGEHNLMPTYKKLAKAIREVDSDTLLFFEPVTWGMFLSGDGLEIAGSGFNELPDEKSVFTWHYYCMFERSLNQDDRYPLKQKTECDSLLGPQVFNAVAKDKKKLKTASFMSEWGGEKPNATLHKSTAVKELEFVMDKSDQSFESWTFYDLNSIVDHQGNLLPTAMYTFARPFAQAIAGTPLVMTFHSTTNKFTFTYEADPAIEAPTEIAVPAVRYPDGFEVQVSDGLAWEMAEERVGVISVYPVGQKLADKQNVSVNITPKSAVMLV